MKHIKLFENFLDEEKITKDYFPKEITLEDDNVSGKKPQYPEGTYMGNIEYRVVNNENGNEYIDNVSVIYTTIPNNGICYFNTSFISSNKNEADYVLANIEHILSKRYKCNFEKDIKLEII